MPIYPANWKYLGPRPRYHNGTFPKGDPRWLIHHYSVGATGSGDAALLHGENPNHVSVQFVIGREGKVFQCADTNISCNHAGRSEWEGVEGLNRHSIGIEYTNYGFGFPEKHHSSVMLAHKNDPHRIMAWEVFPEEQIMAGVALTKWLFETIPSLRESLGHDDISPGRKSDPGPAFADAMARMKAVSKR